MTSLSIQRSLKLAAGVLFCAAALSTESQAQSITQPGTPPNRVPEGGTSIALLAVGLLGVEVVRRKLKASKA